MRQEQRRVAAELTGPLHSVLGDQGGLAEVAAPHAAQHHVLGEEDQLAFLTLLDAATPDGLQELMGFVEAAGPLQQQGALSGWPKHQRREDVRVLQLHGAINVGSSTPCPHRNRRSAHAERKPQQVSLVEALGLCHGLLGR